MVHLMGEGAEQRRQKLRNFNQPVNADNETKAWNFLETRAQLLLRAYPTTIEVRMFLLLNYAFHYLCSCYNPKFFAPIRSSSA